MDLIIGGAYQGKLTLAAREYGLTPGDICDLAAGEPALGARCYIHLEELTRRIRNLSTRGIAMGPGQTLADVMAVRAPLYERYADLVFDCPGGVSLIETAQQLQKQLERAGLIALPR